MIQIVCAIRDVKSELFGRPIFTQTTGVAIRQFTDEVNRKDPDNPLNRHPEDFSLYHIGSYDDNEGKMIPFTLPKILARADQVKIESEDRTISAY
jgi:hypothetical protein